MKTLTKLCSAVSFAAVTGFAAPVLAADTYMIDPAHAWVQFSTNHVGWANARGTFNAVSGEIEFDKEDVTKSSVNVVIEAASIDTNLEARDDHLRSPDFLNAEEFPTIEFVSTSIEKTGDRTGLITGDMTLVGVTKPVVLDVVWNSESPLPWNDAKIKTGFSATGSIDSKEFGITKMEGFGLGPVINLMIDIEALKQ
ncbi:YceI family protein [Cognatishimia sp. SS12]|uniref:YceI family protein n=1 Tax=Cognatishimia sp. SS12 TaxID=2979465 RepID=UPI00232C1E28|nr:YceI family protein [Cognatishimia sp. SS12]MDC0739545.1 YceI family protein [Cognatishimia sp. SS12]